MANSFLTIAEVKEMIGKIKLHMEELDHEYQLYFTKKLRIPPEKKRTALENMIRIITRNRYAPSLQFKISNLVQKYNLYKSLWDKKLEMYYEYGTSDAKRVKEMREQILEEERLWMEKHRKKQKKPSKEESSKHREVKVKAKTLDKTAEDLSKKIFEDLVNKKVKISDLSVVEKAVKSKLTKLKEKFGEDKEFSLDYEIKDGKIKFKAKVKVKKK